MCIYICATYVHIYAYTYVCTYHKQSANCYNVLPLYYIYNIIAMHVRPVKFENICMYTHAYVHESISDIFKIKLNKVCIMYC